MKFLKLLDGAEVLSETGDPEIKGLEYDSRRIQPGFAFVAMKGESTDGNRYIDAAIQKGAVAVVTIPRPSNRGQMWRGRKSLMGVVHWRD